MKALCVGLLIALSLFVISQLCLVIRDSGDPRKLHPSSDNKKNIKKED